MFFTIPAQPMSRAEEAYVLLQTGCAAPTVDTLLDFADRYRLSMTADAVQKNRKLGTRALLRIARRVAQLPKAAAGDGDGADLHVLLSRAVLAEFLPATEAMNLQRIFEETGIKKRTPAVSVCLAVFGFLFFLRDSRSSDSGYVFWVAEESAAGLLGLEDRR